MGTTWSVTVHPDSSTANAPALQSLLQEKLNTINHLMSTYDPESEVARFNKLQSDAWFPISVDTYLVISRAQKISALTGGAFDISVGPLVELWGFGPLERQQHIPTEEQVQQLLRRIGYHNLEIKAHPAAIRKLIPDLHIDLSAIAKGYAVDALAKLLKDQGYSNFLVEVGGELQISGQRDDGGPWRIAIEKPVEDVREVQTIFALTDTAVATSGNYRNFYVENGQHYAHTIDPVSGRPARHKLASATILDPDCARADALATAMMVMGEDRGRQFCEDNNIPAYFLIHEGTGLTSYSSPAFKRFTEKMKHD